MRGLAALLALAVRSAWNRRLTLGLTLTALTLSVTLLLALERLRLDTRASFVQAVSGTDLIVGARASPIELTLYAVFRLGRPTQEIGWAAAQALARHPAVAWTLPLALGDSHRGFPVLGTPAEYFARFHYGDRRALAFAAGRPYQGPFEAVLGAEVARRLGYAVGARITLSHGGGEFAPEHADKPFTVVGVLAPTGTPVDRTVHVSLESIEAIHLDWQGGAPIPGLRIPPELTRKFDLTPKTVTAVLVGLKSRAQVFAMQRWVQAYRDEPLMAVLPGVALDELWALMAVGERALLSASALVAAVSLVGLVAVILAGLNERRRELAILRALGAGPRRVLLLLVMEGAGLTLAACALGLALSRLLALAAGPWLAAHYGIQVQIAWPHMGEWLWLTAVCAVGTLASLIPAWRAYRLSLADGLTPHV
ncbi:MAG: ABC transporter permease [Thiobacillaceae bacterium]|nr:ABC transporter permease [Thiobacillaceae bacterium]